MLAPSRPTSNKPLVRFSQPRAAGSSPPRWAQLNTIRTGRRDRRTSAHHRATWATPLERSLKDIHEQGLKHNNGGGCWDIALGRGRRERAVSERRVVGAFARQAMLEKRVPCPPNR